MSGINHDNVPREERPDSPLAASFPGASVGEPVADNAQQDVAPVVPAAPILLGKEAAAALTPGAEANAAEAWELHLGPATLSRSGLQFKPQFKFGAKARRFTAEAGLGDVRDGLKLDMNLGASAEAEVIGHSVNELHDRMKETVKSNVADASSQACERARSWGFDARCLEQRFTPERNEAWAQAIENARTTLSTSAFATGSRVAQIAQSLGFNVADLQRILEDRSEKPMTLQIRASAAVGAAWKLCLGWFDTQGYRMLGVGHTLSSGISWGANLFAGKHCSGTSMKLVLGIGNFTFEYTLPLSSQPNCPAVTEPLTMTTLAQESDAERRPMAAACA